MIMIRFVLLSSTWMAFVAATAVSSSSQHHQHGHDMSVPVKRPDMELLLRQRREVSLTPNFCMTGFIMDRFCIDLTTLLDNPSLRSLQYPDQHSVHCLIEVPSCVESGYELLSAPSTTGGDYGRVVRFDEMGNAMLTELAAQVGICSTCSGSGTIQQGLSLTVIGYLANNETASDGTPPDLNVTSLLASSVGCSNFTSIGSTTSPTTTPDSSPTDAPVASPTDSVSSTNAPVATPSAPVATPTAPVTTPSAPVVTPSAPVTPTTKSTPTSAATITVHSCGLLAGVAILIMGLVV